MAERTDNGMRWWREREAKQVARVAQWRDAAFKTITLDPRPPRTFDEVAHEVLRQRGVSGIVCPFCGLAMRVTSVDPTIAALTATCTCGASVNHVGTRPECLGRASL